MEEEKVVEKKLTEKEKVKSLTIVEKDFIMKPISSTNFYFWDLTFYKRVKKRSTGNYELELGKTLHGLPLKSALAQIAYKRTAERFQESNIRLFEFIKSLDDSYKEVVALCKETLPEKFDNGE